MDYFTLDKDFWHERLLELVKYAALNPWEFIYYVVLLLSPFFLTSAILSYKLARQIDAEDKRKRREERRKKGIQKAQAKKTD